MAANNDAVRVLSRTASPRGGGPRLLLHETTPLLDFVEPLIGPSWWGSRGAEADRGASYSWIFPHVATDLARLRGTASVGEPVAGSGPASD